MGASKDIKVSTKTPHPMMTTAHEVGHFIDHKGIPLSEGTTGRTGGDGWSVNRSTLPSMKRVKDAIANSQAYKELEALKGKEFEVKYTYGDKEYTYKTKADEKHIRYLQDPKEAWARAYSQYVAVKSGNPTMAKELNEMRNTSGKVNYTSQWDDDDFKPIEKAIDKMFGELGWRK